MQNHQLETISNEAQKTARQIFRAAKGIWPQILDAISADTSRTHPFWRAPNGFRLPCYGLVTQHLEPIKLRSHHSMFRDTAGTQSLGIMSKLVRTDCERFYTWPRAMIAQRADVPLTAPQPSTAELWCVCCSS
jgi:hypothetical protein